MSSFEPTKAFEQYQGGTDFVSQMLRLKERIIKLERDFAQGGRSLGWSLPTPTLPATTVPVINDTGRHVTVYIGGGTVSNVIVDGSTIVLTSGAFRVNPNGTIAVTYTVAPGWLWYAD